MNALVAPATREELVTRNKREAFEFKVKSAEYEARSAAASAQQRDFKVSVTRDVPVPAPPFWGARVTPTSEVPFDGMYAGMDLKTLYRLHWGGGTRSKDGAGDNGAFEEAGARRLRAAPRRRSARRARSWRGRSRLRLFPCQSDGQDLIVYEPGAFAAGSLVARGKIEEVARFTFPRQADREGLCLSDYFQPVAGSKFDVVAFQLVSVGPGADELGAALDKRGEYAESLFIHGLAMSATEGLAEWHHKKIRSELKLEDERGKRYSFGYSACPDLADQGKLFALLKPEESIGVALTSAFQIVPEASTTLVVHHPQASYYR